MVAVQRPKTTNINGYRNKSVMTVFILLLICPCDKIKVKVLAAQSCPIIGNCMDCSPPDPSAHGILQARILEWQPFPSPGDFPDPGIEPGSPALQADS